MACGRRQSPQAASTPPCPARAAQSLLQAVGIGAQRSLPAAATINWVLKDGLGRLGRLTVATRFGESFDSDLKVGARVGVGWGGVEWVVVAGRGGVALSCPCLAFQLHPPLPPLQFLAPLPPPSPPPPRAASAALSVHDQCHLRCQPEVSAALLPRSGPARHRAACASCRWSRRAHLHD